MNTASRMESTGVPGRIQVSKETADLITKGGKESWLIQRETKVQAKGKGELTTFFLDMETRLTESGSHHSACSSLVNAKDELMVGAMTDSQEEEKKNRIAEWTVEVMANILKSIMAERQSNGIKPDNSDTLDQLELSSLSHNFDNKTVIDEGKHTCHWILCV
jgi:leucyl aminopeptidase (aminopeptidase T)